MNKTNDICNCIDTVIDKTSGINEISDVLNEEFNKAMRRNISDYYRFGCDMYLNEKGKRYKLIVDAMRTAKSSKTSLNNKVGMRNDLSNKCCFITLNPAPEVPFGKLYIAVNKIVALKGIKETAHWTFEQRGICDEERGKGFHAHILFLKSEDITIDWKAIEDKIDYLTSDLYPRGVDERKLNKMSYNPDIFHEKKLYLQGIKTLKSEKEKELDKLKHIQDVEWRIQMKLENYYVSRKYLDFHKSAFIFKN